MNNQTCRRCNGLMLEVTDYCKQFNLIKQNKCMNCGNIEDKRILLNRDEATRHGRRNPRTGEWKGEPVRNPTMLGPCGLVFSTGINNNRHGGAE